MFEHPRVPVQPAHIPQRPLRARAPGDATKVRTLLCANLVAARVDLLRRASGPIVVPDCARSTEVNMWWIAGGGELGTGSEVGMYALRIPRARAVMASSSRWAELH
ncbi:hypothetical protein SCP_1600900 [Sparassis crispa]|uniref:Uncharacterized protein n=1 Tax=Sparassis crispa TaxID=139825 RepID=A0A401H4S3_9APHY|nr:hypothetical protein SCP_1600900 [Sparassis crispa]GBE89428.1 hypothetical protein SCP_1600900 [Sparassis crispa]